MKLAWSPSERIVRSVGEHPNGIVGFNVAPEDSGFSVCSKLEPRGLRSVLREGDDAEALGETRISVEEAAESVADESVAVHLYGVALSAIEHGVMVWGIQGDFAPVHEAIDEAQLYAELIRERFAD